MALQLIMGVPGSGKTHYLYQQIIKESLENPGRQFLVIVPEQSTLQAQKEIVTLHPRHGVQNIDIVSFQRLAYRVFAELSMECLPVLDDMGKSMVLRKVAAGQKKQLSLFGNHLDQAGFINQLKSMLSELCQYGVSPEMIGAMGEQADTDLLRQKLKDLTVLYQGFKDYIEKRYITTEEILDVLCRVLPQSQLISNSVIALDGYTGFTPVQYRLLGLFLQHGQQVRVTVTLDEDAYLRGKGNQENLFHMSYQIRKKLTVLAREQKSEVLEDICLFQSRPYEHLKQQRPVLDFLGSQIFRYGHKVWEEAQDQELAVFQAMNPQREVRYVVQQIQGLVREQGMRFRDIAVVAGDIPGYGMELGYQFDQAGIPYFMDDKKNILSHPMVELIRAVMEVLIRDFSYEAVFRYLKTGMSGVKPEDVYTLETYVRAMGIRGYRRWQQEWTQESFAHPYLNLEQINQSRRQFLEPLQELREFMAQSKRQVKDWIQGIRTLLEQLNIPDQLNGYTRHLLETGKVRLAEEYDQVYGLVDELFTRLDQLLGEEKAGRKEFGQILDAGLSEIQVGVIPVTVDRVVIGDITRSRLSHIKVLFFVGLNEGIVPAVKESKGILTDRDRGYLERQGLELAPDTKAEGFMQRYYLYLVLTKPERKLYLTFSALDGSGKSRRPSSLINDIRRLFPKLSIRSDSREKIYTVNDGKRRLISGMRTGTEETSQPEFLELYRWFYGKENYKEDIQRILDAVYYSYQEKGIGRAAARRLYGAVLSGSVTRLEQYASCAYAHFLRYGLELKERKDYEVAAVDVGNLFHDSIDRVFRQVQESGGTWTGMDTEQRRAMVSQAVQAASAEYGNTIFQSSARYAYLTSKVEQMTDRTIWALSRQLEKGDFTPSGFEVAFAASDHLDAMRIPLSDSERLQLKGRIDRIDLYEEKGRLYVKVIDYKSGQTSFDLSSLYYGLQLQLGVYMNAAVELMKRKNPDKEVVPAGMFYYHIDDPVIDWKPGIQPQEVESQILKKLRMSGLVNSDLEAIRHLDREIQKESDVIPVAVRDGLIQEARSSVASGQRLERLFSYVRQTMKEQGEKILEGDIGIRPCKQGTKTACDYCPYHGVCGFDLKTGGFAYRNLKHIKPDEIWDEIAPGEELAETEQKGETPHGNSMD